VEVVSRPGSKPAFDLRVLTGDVVVDDEVHIL
jgi:hypothetical protein